MDQSDASLSIDHLLRFSVLIGVGLLAYSAGYTRAIMISQNTFIFSSGGATTKSIFLVSGVPDYIGLAAFLGIGSLLLSLLGYALSK